MRFLSLSLCMIAVVGAAPAVCSAEPTAEEWARVMNLSGRQRMLTQKMTKEALFITADIEADKLRGDLRDTMTMFEESLEGLKSGSEELGLPATDNPRIVKQLNKVLGMYMELKPTLDEVATGGVLNPTQAQKLADLNLPLLKEMNKAVKMYERKAKKVLGGDEHSAVVINLAGKQRMLTQKMTKECLLVHNGVNAEANRLNLRVTTSLFDRTLKGLADGDENLELPGTESPEIRAQLETVATIWAEVQPLMQAAAEDRDLSEGELTTLAKINVDLLREMNKGVKLFEQSTN